MMNEGQPSVELSEVERQLLDRHLAFYRALATGQRNPTTPAQKHFVEVALGHIGAETEHEFAYMKWMGRRALDRASRAEGDERQPDRDGPTDEWFTREDWRAMRGRQRWDGR
jgi:uncharacterized protein YifE (UPF0438 family)